jgi:hypothetical protein
MMESETDARCSASISNNYCLTDAASVATLLTLGTHLSAADCPTKIEEMEIRSHRALAEALAWFCAQYSTRHLFATTSLTRFGHGPGRIHWEARPIESLLM